MKTKKKLWHEKIFTYGIIFILFFSVLVSGSVDLWAQTVIHLGTILLLLFYFFISYQRKEIVFISIPPSLIILFFSLILSYFFSYSKFTSREEFLNWLNYLTFFLFALLFSEEKEFFCKGIIGVAIFLVLRGIFDYFFQGVYPLKSSLLNPNILAGYLIMVIPLTISQVSKLKVKSSKLKIGYLASGILLLVGLILTGSLGAILSLFFAFILFFGQLSTLKKVRGLFLISILIIIPLLVFKFSQSGVSNRLLWWQGALKMFFFRPLTGIGLGNFARYYPQFKTQGLSSLYAHNYYLQIIAENGIFALIGFLGILIYFFRPASPSGGQRKKDLGICVGVIALLAHNFIDYNLSVPAVALTFWTLLGLEMNKEKRTMYLNGKKYFLVVLTILLFFFSYLLIRFFMANRAYARGLYHFNTEKDLFKAEKELLISLKLDPYYSPTYKVLSGLYAQYFFQDKSVHWLKRALIPIDEAIKKEKNYAPYWLDKAWIHYFLGEKEIARETLEKAKKLKIPIHLTINLEKLL